MTVAVTDAGLLVLTTSDGVTLQPITVADAQALADAIPAAEKAATRQTMTAAIRSLTDVLVVQGDAMAATVTVTPTTVTASVDPATFADAQTQLGLTPDSAGALVMGPVTVTTPPVDPTPTATPDPTAPASPTPAPTTGTA